MNIEYIKIFNKKTFAMLSDKFVLSASAVQVTKSFSLSLALWFPAPINPVLSVPHDQFFLDGQFDKFGQFDQIPWSLYRQKFNLQWSSYIAEVEKSPVVEQTLTNKAAKAATLKFAIGQFKKADTNSDLLQTAFDSVEFFKLLPWSVVKELTKNGGLFVRTIAFNRDFLTTSTDEAFLEDNILMFKLFMLVRELVGEQESLTRIKQILTGEDYQQTLMLILDIENKIKCIEVKILSLRKQIEEKSSCPQQLLMHPMTLDEQIKFFEDHLSLALAKKTKLVELEEALQALQTDLSTSRDTHRELLELKEEHEKSLRFNETCLKTMTRKNKETTIQFLRLGSYIESQLEKGVSLSQGDIRQVLNRLRDDDNEEDDDNTSTPPPLDCNYEGLAQKDSFENQMEAFELQNTRSCLLKEYESALVP